MFDRATYKQWLTELVEYMKANPITIHLSSDRTFQLHECVDVSLASTEHSLRVIDSSKYKDPKRVCSAIVRSPLGKWEYADYFANHYLPENELIEGYARELSGTEGYARERERKKERERASPIALFTDSDMDVVNEYVKDNFTVAEGKKGILSLTRVHSSHCPICEIAHDTDGQYVFKKEGAIVLGCFRADKQYHTLKEGYAREGTNPTRRRTTKVRSRRTTKGAGLNRMLLAMASDI